MRIWFYLLMLVTVFEVQGQSHSFHHYRVEDGLSHNSVVSMLQDERGFMWFGTKDGLNRFDGYSYKVFQHKAGDSTSIGSNFIRCLKEYNHTLWVGTDTGLFKYDKEMESFELIKNTKDQPILDIENDCNGNIWFVAAGNLFKKSLKTGKEEIYKQTGFSFISSSKSGDIYVSSGEDVFKYIEANNSLQKIDLQLGVNTNIVITALSVDSVHNTLYIGTKAQGVLTYSLRNSRTTSLFPKNENPLFVRNFLRKDKNELWIASESGIYIYDLKSKEFEHLKKNYNDPYAVSDNAIYCLTLDQEEGVWVGTYFGGVNYYSKQYTPIKRYFPRVGENSISGNAVREIKKDNYGNLWIGTEDAGLNQFKSTTETFKNYAPIESNGAFPNYNIHGLLPRGSELWIGTFEHGLDVMDIPSGKIIDHFGTGKDEGGLRSDFILYIFEAENKDIYILTSSGIHKFLENSRTFEVVTGFPEVYHYTYMMEDHKGVLWAGTYWDGLYYFNTKTGEKGFFKYDSKDPHSISTNVINGIYEDSSKNLWITTENGLNLFNPKEQNFNRIGKKDGLPSNVTYSILEDKSKELWISTSSGLVNYDPDSKKMEIFTKSNGLLSDQFNYSSAFKDDSGEMYFGSVNGLIRFNPDTFIKNTYQAPIYITDIQINNKKVQVGEVDSPLDNSILFSKELILNNKQSTFDLQFASLSYTAPKMTKYWYKLEGLNDNWVSLGKNHEVSFTALAPGNYDFKVKALNSHGVWSKNTQSLKIEILPPFFASKTAYFLYFLVFLFLLVFLFRYYHHYTHDKNNHRIMQLENAKEKEIYQAKIEFFTNVAHEIRTPLTLIKGPLEKLLKSTYKSPEIPHNLGIMEKNTSRLLNLVNELLDFRKTEMQHVQLSFVEVSITGLLQDTHVRFSQLVRDKNLRFKLIVPQENVIASVDEEAVKKVLSNLFSNAINYSKKKVKVKLIVKGSSFQVIIKNDGKLIPTELQQRIFEPFYRVPGEPTKVGTGIGLSLAHSLTELHHGKLYFKATRKMNTFILEMPVKQITGIKSLNKASPADRSHYTNEIPVFTKNRPVILIVEDNQELTSFIYTELSETYNVLIAAQGQEALRFFQDFEIHLVISDLMMPVMDGITFCKQLKENPKTNHIPVIILTAKTALNIKIDGLESGADAYISKPFSIDHLQVQISNLLSNRKTILEHYSNSPLAHLHTLSLSADDQDFLKKLDKIIEDNLKDPNLSVALLAGLLNMSRSTLYRKIKEISDLSPNELINISRLKKAAFLLKNTNSKIFEVAEMVGYRSQTSFGRNFQKQFEMTPSEFMNSFK
ncbi:hybrid sensor histidine kinase/response regulator transcription factor [Flavimarina sp. Hel_I_48]|uniref:hybrid sensor histidine kinase/response regulator transcription factor n=1 Tax=Flavimarina sp. Hel_I_48 TaxID=1392488 RepID=UPI0004DEF457|nr:hybrid sensor histidine kinase/response regulator transcription factor [Flavimarina sp. Hel_I_48]